MSKILHITLGILSALSVCGISSGEEPQQANGLWVPTATVANANGSKSHATQSLRALNSAESNLTRIERALPLQSNQADSQEIGANSIIQNGNVLLSERRWVEAKKYFEKALRIYPNSRVLRSQFAEARRRCEISVRYQDETFTSLTKSSSLEDQLAIFDEVFVDVDEYHVDRPRYSELFTLGVAGVAEALEEDAFYKQNGVPLDMKAHSISLFDALCRTAKNWEMETEDDVRRSVLWLAKQLRRRVGIQESAIVSEFLCSAICSLDAYSASLTPLQVDDVFSMIDGNFVGIGVELKTEAPTKIVRVIPFSPAEEGGLQVGDELIEIDGRSTLNLTGAEIGELLQGREGDIVSLRLRSQDGRVRSVAAKRRPIEVPSVENVHLLSVPGYVGYLKITCFQKTTSDELKRAIQTLSEEGARSIVVDLRQNPGGLLQEAIKVSDVFLSSGAIVKTQGRNGTHVFSATKRQACTLPIVLVVDSNSASAAEIFAGAMQENGRGVVVGTQSYGKGTVQAIVPLTKETEGAKPIAGLRLTTEKFYSPTGRAYGGVGVIPDIEVFASASVGETAQLQAAINQAYADNADSLSTSRSDQDASGNMNAVRRVSKPVNEVDADAFLQAAVQEANRQTESLELQKRIEKTPSRNGSFMRLEGRFRSSAVDFE